MTDDLEAMFNAESAPEPEYRNRPESEQPGGQTDNAPETQPAPGAPEGRGRHLTFLHGMGGSPLTWEGQVVKLPPVGVRAQAPWLRGMRPAAKERFDFADAAADLLMGLQLEGAPHTSVIGHNLGAMVGMQMAVDAPDVVTHLVLVGAQIRPPRGALKAQRLAIKMTPRSRFEAMGVSKNRVLTALDTLAGYEAGDHLDRITAKTLVVVGEQDRAGAAAAQELVAGIDSAEFVLVPGAGTAPMNENTEAFNAALWEFLDIEPHDY